MNMTDNSLFLMRNEHHFNLQTKLTPCINNIIGLAVIYLKEFRRQTCYNEVNVLLAEAT